MLLPLGNAMLEGAGGGGERLDLIGKESLMETGERWVATWIRLVASRKTCSCWVRKWIVQRRYEPWVMRESATGLMIRLIWTKIGPVGFFHWF